VKLCSVIPDKFNVYKNCI